MMHVAVKACVMCVCDVRACRLALCVAVDDDHAVARRRRGRGRRRRRRGRSWVDTW